MSLKNKGYLDRFWQRFGFIPQNNENHDLVWIHAVSVGEVMATQTIVKYIQSDFPDHKLVITTGTPTGAATVEKLYGNSVIHYFQPYDLGCIVKRFLKRLRPKVLLVLETELWPNLFYFCQKKSIPVLLVNARLSSRSTNRYQKILSLTEPMLKNVVAIMAQTETDRKHLIEIGAKPESIIVTGSIKFDIEIDDDLKKIATEYKQEQLANRKVWIAASTHEQEEEMMLDVHNLILKHFKNCLLILVPRHNVRTREVVDLLNLQKINYQLHSDSKKIKADTQVLLIDTMGELVFFYGVADLAFIGGSLIKHGGHNPIEAACFSIPILIGPYDFNFAEIDSNLIRRNGAIRINNENELKNEIIDCFNNPDRQQIIGANALQFVQESQGSSKKTWNIIKSFLD